MKPNPTHTPATEPVVVCSRFRVLPPDDPRAVYPRSGLVREAVFVRRDVAPERLGPPWWQFPREERAAGQEPERLFPQTSGHKECELADDDWTLGHVLDRNDYVGRATEFVVNADGLNDNGWRSEPVEQPPKHRWGLLAWLGWY